MKRLKITTLVITMLMSITSVFSQSIGRWEKLATLNVSNTTDRDVVDLSSEGLFTALKFKVEGGRAVDFKAVYIQYGNGSISKLDFNQTVRAGGESPILDLKGDKRIIKKITLYYKTISKGNGKLKQAKVQIWGRH